MARQWFRFGRKPKEPTTDAVAAVEVPAEAVREEAARPDVQADPVTPAEAADPTRKRRRRGSRGGRGKKKTTQANGQAEKAEAASSTSEKADAKEPTRGRPERKPERRQSQSRKSDKSGRRRTATRRAALPAAKRDLVISVDVGEQRVAILEDDRVAEVYLERPERRSIAGNIYLGVVDNVLPGMEAAFVEIGLEKNGFLYVDEIVGPELEGRKGAKKIQDLIRRGETVLVQAVKDPMKSKGARLTTEISLPGRFLVYVPNGEGYGVSRRLEDDERARLKEIVKALDAKGGGIIVRTAAEGASAEDVERDLVFLQRLWKTIQTKAKDATAPSIVYEEAELPLRIIRDLFAGDFSSALIDDDRTYRRIVSYLKKTSPHMIERVQRYQEKEPLFQAYGVDKEISSTLERRVNLPSGGYLIFDYAEAFTVVDVNTGRFVGSRGKSSAGRLEDTIVKNNLEAVKEVVRQLRLRDIGGIIVIDFIDMSNPKNRATVEDALRTELERDRTKTYVVEISPLGLVEMTRQNVTDGPREILTRRCPVCEGDGFVVSDETMAIEIERRLRALAAGGVPRTGVPRRRPPTRPLAPRRLRWGAAGRDRGGCATALLPRRSGERPRPSRPLRGARAGQARRVEAVGAVRRGRDDLREARRGRALRRGSRCREARRLRRRRRRLGEARREEGLGQDRTRPRRHRLRAAGRGRGRRRRHHLRGRGGEADACAEPQEGSRDGQGRARARDRRNPMPRPKTRPRWRLLPRARWPPTSRLLRRRSGRGEGRAAGEDGRRSRLRSAPRRLTVTTRPGTARA